MNLVQLIERLECEDPGKVCPMGFTNPHSYRGYYHQVAFEPARDVPIGQMLDAAKGAVGATYTGYKGGEYTMTEDTECYLAFWGHVGEEIGPTLLELMLHNAQQTPSVRDRIREALTTPINCPKCGSQKTCRCGGTGEERLEARVTLIEELIRYETRRGLDDE